MTDPGHPRTPPTGSPSPERAATDEADVDDATVIAARRSVQPQDAAPDLPDDATALASRRLTQPDDATAIAARRGARAGGGRAAAEELSTRADTDQTQLRGVRRLPAARRSAASAAPPLAGHGRSASVPDAAAAAPRHAPREPAAVVVPRNAAVPPRAGVESLPDDLARLDRARRSRRRGRLVVTAAVAVLLLAAATLALVLLLS